MKKLINLINLSLITIAFTILFFTACGMFEPGPEGDKLREGVREGIRSIVPAPWGELIAVSFMTITGTIAELKRRKANANQKALTTTIKAIDAIATPEEKEDVVGKIADEDGTRKFLRSKVAEVKNGKH